jgi:hypothetical protein
LTRSTAKREKQVASNATADEQARTFEYCVKQYMSTKTWADGPDVWEQVIKTNAYPVIGSMPVKLVDKGVMIKVHADPRI